MKILMAIGLSLAAWAACGAAAPLESATAGPVYCFSATVRARDGHRMAGCADSLPLCRRALGKGGN